MNWSCGAGGNVRCNQATASRVDGPHKTQQSLFSVLISEVGSKTYFNDGNYGNNYDGLTSGHVMRGEHFWSYKRRSGRSVATDGEYASDDGSPQLTFGVNRLRVIWN